MVGELFARSTTLFGRGGIEFGFVGSNLVAQPLVRRRQLSNTTFSFFELGFIRFSFLIYNQLGDPYSFLKSGFLQFVLLDQVLPVYPYPSRIG